MNEKPKDWYYDNVEFMNEPFKFIAEHPDDFSEAMQAMAQYQFKTQQDSRPWGDLPMYLSDGAQLEQSLQRKMMQADDLARVIMTADLQRMRALASDAKFAEKKELFQNLARLPPENRGMLAIHDVMSSMSAAGQLPALSAFPNDLDYACQKVAEANAALRMLDDKYTALFLAVRTTAKLSGAAAQMKAERERGRPFGPPPQSKGAAGMPPPPGQGRAGMPPPPGQGRSGMPPQRGMQGMQGMQGMPPPPSQGRPGMPVEQGMSGGRPPFETPLQQGLGGTGRQGLGGKAGLRGQEGGQERRGRYS